MNRSMITATNTLSQLQKQLDTIANNLANVNTSGFKRREATFTDLLVQQFNNQPYRVADQIRLTPAGIRQGTGAKLGQVQMDTSQGSLKITNRPLDIALTEENQYFAVNVQDEEGAITRLTRDGAFYLSPVSANEVMLVTADGHQVLDNTNNLITIRANPKEISVSPEGELRATYEDGTVETRSFMVYHVRKPQFLEQFGENLLGFPRNAIFDGDVAVAEDEIVTLLEGPLRNNIAIQQGALEQSNVDMSKEMTDLINVQRAYQFHSRAITLSDQMMGIVNGIR